MIFYLDHFIQIWLIPPGCNILSAFFGFLLWRSRPLLSRLLLTFSLISLWAFSTPYVAQHLVNNLQFKYPTLSIDQISDDESPSAIVVLEAGLNLLTPEYDEPTVSELTLTRLRYAAFLHKQTGIPVLVSGSNPTNPTINDANTMAKALHDYFGVTARWKENRGVNTAQEGIYVAKILKSSGIEKIYLVTHALHMPRAVYAFQNSGIEVIPAPTGYIEINPHLGKFSNYLPSIDALRINSSALREYIGIFWYRIHYGKSYAV